jgi:hypothetical protein
MKIKNHSDQTLNLNNDKELLYRLCSYMDHISSGDLNYTLNELDLKGLELICFINIVTNGSIGNEDQGS